MYVLWIPHVDLFGRTRTAYTAGHQIVFGAGRFAPGTEKGRHLIAHELTPWCSSPPRRGSPTGSEWAMTVLSRGCFSDNRAPQVIRAERNAR